jgi:hypothetical protein
MEAQVAEIGLKHRNKLTLSEMIPKINSTQSQFCLA